MNFQISTYIYFVSLQVVLHGVVNMQLPNQWLWDMVDEFVYQFQSFCQYRAKMKNKTEQEIALLRQHDQVRHWVMFQRCSWIHKITSNISKYPEIISPFII